MIRYLNGVYGASILFRFHGSALIKAVPPAIVSTALLYSFGTFWPNADITKNVINRPIEHPYAIGCFVVAFTFLVTFRVNFSYSRYWEAAANLHTMFSKWLDVGATVAAFHYQSKMYDSVRPPPFASQEVMDVSRVREREKEYTPQKLKEELESCSRRRFSRSQINGSIFISQRVKDKKNDDQNNLTPNNKCDEDDQKLESVRITPSVKGSRRFSVCGKPRLEGGIYTSRPSLFLQEVTHLLSLLMAVALSTLRNDSDGIELPLVEYEHGSEFPPVDPDSLSSYERKKFYGESRLLTCLTFVFGVDRTTEQRVLYNAARPFGVLGGVSDSEMLLLKSCKGPSSKVVLCSMWLMEFISREYLAGSVGNVAPPIVSRLYQEISNGKLGFQQARKIAFVPFPFPHSQLVTFFNLVILWVVPFLAYSFVDNMPLACAINFLTISIFVSLHEVARELENPFQNVPNDLPLCTYMAHFNEALISTYSGFHPDSWWELPQNYQDRDDHIAISRRRSGDI